jgi:hypothetical protein
MDNRQVNELKELAKLKRMQVLNEQQTKVQQKLLTLHSIFKSLTYNEMMQKLVAKPEAAVVVYSVRFDEIVDALKARYSALESYVEPKIEGDLVTYTFPSSTEMASFFMQAAQKEPPFVVFDLVTKKVTSYSNGDGKLYHPDGREVIPGELLVQSDFDEKDFVMPSPPAPGMGAI